MKAIIEVDVPDYQIGQEVSIYYKDTMMIKGVVQEPRKITYEDVKGYCKPRCLTIIDNELLYELTHPKIKALEQEPKIDVLDKIRTEINSCMSIPFEQFNQHDESDYDKGLARALFIIDKHLQKGDE